jgi:hypothetical protein
MTWVAFGLLGLIGHRMLTGRAFSTGAAAQKNVIEMQGAQGGQSL